MYQLNDLKIGQHDISRNISTNQSFQIVIFSHDLWGTHHVIIRYESRFEDRKGIGAAVYKRARLELRWEQN